MEQRPDACPSCRATHLIKSGHACGRQRWTCKVCGRQFTRTTARGKPLALKTKAVELYASGLSMSATAKRLGVSGQSVFRWVKDPSLRLAVQR